MKATKKKAKRVKRKRLEPVARIRRRLMRLWTARVHEMWGERCAVCGSDSLPNAHHIENRNTCRALRYDPMNGVLLCPSHHKYGKDSAHKGGIWFADWLQRNHRERWDYVLAHRNDDINLNDREVLASIEAGLREEKSYDGYPDDDGGHGGLQGAVSGGGCCDAPSGGADAAARDSQDTQVPQDGSL